MSEDLNSQFGNNLNPKTLKMHSQTKKIRKRDEFVTVFWALLNPVFGPYRPFIGDWGGS